MKDYINMKNKVFILKILNKTIKYYLNHHITYLNDFCLSQN